jgi:hypothetical protein
MMRDRKITATLAEALEMYVAKGGPQGAFFRFYCGARFGTNSCKRLNGNELFYTGVCK